MMIKNESGKWVNGTIGKIESLSENEIKVNLNEKIHVVEKVIWEKKKFKGLELKGKKIGLIGFGNVAKRVAEVVKGFDMEICVFSKSFSLAIFFFTIFNPSRNLFP
mgnify:CR=1 FL=1